MKKQSVKGSDLHLKKSKYYIIFWSFDIRSDVYLNKNLWNWSVHLMQKIMAKHRHFTTSLSVNYSREGQDLLRGYHFKSGKKHFCVFKNI